MQHIVSYLAMLLIAAALGGSGAVASPEGKRVALITTPNQNPFIGAWNSSFIKTAESHGMKVTNTTTPYDAALQSQQIDDAIAQKFDVIVLINTNHRAVIPALTRVKKAGVPVILAVAPIEREQENLFLSFVGADHTELGRLAAENLVKAFKAEGKSEARVAAITGIGPQLITKLRMDGFREVLAKHSGVKLVAEEDGKWNTALSEKIAGQLLVRFSGRGGLDGIYGMADNQAAGIVQAIESAGLKLGVANKGIIVVASNCMKEGIRNIRAGKQYSTNTQLPTANGKATAERVAAYFGGKPLKKYEILKSAPITNANVAQYAEACTY